MDLDFFSFFIYTRYGQYVIMPCVLCVYAVFEMSCSLLIGAQGNLI